MSRRGVFWLVSTWRSRCYSVTAKRWSLVLCIMVVFWRRLSQIWLGSNFFNERASSTHAVLIITIDVFFQGWKASLNSFVWLVQWIVAVREFSCWELLVVSLDVSQRRVVALSAIWWELSNSDLLWKTHWLVQLTRRHRSIVAFNLSSVSTTVSKCGLHLMNRLFPVRTRWF